AAQRRRHVRSATSRLRSGPNFSLLPLRRRRVRACCRRGRFLGREWSGRRRRCHQRRRPTRDLNPHMTLVLLLLLTGRRRRRRNKGHRRNRGHIAGCRSGRE
ncbi:unnamed protein product, partial [Ectocarpus sp. 8 AP-2014]